MRKFNSIIKTCLGIGVFTACLSFSAESVLAWGGYSHWEMGQRISDKYNYSDNEKLNFSSGSLLADIGRLSWDRKYTSSDSEKFSDKMLSLASNSSAINFANGWKAHYIQDTSGALSNIDGGPSSYRVKCGWVDEYLRDHKNLNCPINNTCDAWVDYDLIKSTYDNLHNFNPSNKEIDREIKKMYVAFDLQLIANINGWSDSEIDGIENELNRTVGLCMNNNKYIRSVAPSYINLTDISDKDMDIINKTIEFHIDTVENLNSIKLNKAKSDTKNSYIINYSVEDKDKYENMLKKIDNDLKNKGIDISNL